MAMVPFLKMNGLGNDFVVIDARDARDALPNLTPALIARLGARTGDGIGFDQFISIGELSTDATAHMRIWNTDGGEVSACGNATRCVGHLFVDQLFNDWVGADLMEYMATDRVTIQTAAGLLKVLCATEEPDEVTVNMGEPLLAWDQIPLAEPFHDTRVIELQIGPIDGPILANPSVVNMGNPHAIFWVDDISVHDLEKFGPMLEHHPMFPERANITLARVEARDHLTLKVWERGVGLTLSCGTAACAAAVASVRKGYCERLVRVSLPGGDLMIEWCAADNNVRMTGPVAIDFEGELDTDSGHWRRLAGAYPGYM